MMEIDLNTVLRSKFLRLSGNFRNNTQIDKEAANESNGNVIIGLYEQSEYSHNLLTKD